MIKIFQDLESFLNALCHRVILRFFDIGYELYSFFYSNSISAQYSSELQECASKVQNGDIVFFADISHSVGFSDAVSKSYHLEEKIIHVGLIVLDESATVIHALPGFGVVKQNIIKLSSSFFKSSGLVMVKRLGMDEVGINNVPDIACSYTGAPYNDIFSDNNSNSKGEFSFYCSQFVEFVYKKAIGCEVFKKHPMSFNDSDGNIIPYWEKYFGDRGIELPEGEIGTHPGSIYESDKLSLICSAEISNNQQQDEL